MSINFGEAQNAFYNIMRNINKDSVPEFLEWIQNNWLGSGELTDKNHKTEDSAGAILDAIAADLRNSLPLEAVLSSENICPPSSGKNADCDPKYTVHVDAFLYDDELVDTLCDEGQLTRFYCSDCGSRKTLPLTYISHSASRDRLKYIFKCMLPPLDGKVVLDIGSRLGAVLYGAYVLSTAVKIIGVELNSDLCDLQKKIISKYKFEDRVEVIEADIRKCPDIVTKADVVVMNNVFEFFLSVDEQANVWNFLRHTIKKGTLLVTSPRLEESHTGIKLSDWVEEIPLHNVDATETMLSGEEALELGLYRLK